MNCSCSMKTLHTPLSDASFRENFSSLSFTVIFLYKCGKLFQLKLIKFSTVSTALFRASKTITGLNENLKCDEIANSFTSAKTGDVANHITVFLKSVRRLKIIR